MYYKEMNSISFKASVQILTLLYAIIVPLVLFIEIKESLN